MMKIEETVDDIVLILMENNEPLKALGLDQKTIYARVKGYDEYGIWIEHPGLKVPKLPKDPKAKLSKKPTFQTVTSNVLIPWGFIVSLAHFPEVEGFDFPSPFAQHIGFEPAEGRPDN